MPLHGRVMRWDSSLGYGLIKGAAGGVYIFSVPSVLRGHHDLAAGVSVTFVEQGAIYRNGAWSHAMCVVVEPEVPAQ